MSVGHREDLIKLGYEFPIRDEEGKIQNPETVGRDVYVSPSHLIATGVTQLSGKTTTLEAVIIRAIQQGIIKQAIVFKTKVGETGFTQGLIVPPYFRQRSDWQYVSSLLEATLKERLKFERAWIIRVCKNAENLAQVRHNIDEELAKPRLSKLSRNVFTTLAAYLDLVLPQLQYAQFSRTLEIQNGQINIMDLERFSEEIQSLVIRSVLETVLTDETGTIVVMPEAWKFNPQGRGNPCKYATESFIRQGATNSNYLFYDCQDLAGVDKASIKQVTTWILGLQMEKNEVKHTLDQINLPKKSKPKPDDIMSLSIGHFILTTPDETIPVYVQPAWMNDETAKAVATEEIDVKSVQKPENLITRPVGTPLTPALPDHHAINVYARVSKDLVAMRTDFFNKIEAVIKKGDNQVKALATKLTELDVAIKKAVNVDEIVSLVLQKMPLPTIDEEKIIAEVVKRVPKMAGAVTYEVAPLIKLQKDFQEAAKAQILHDINDLDEESKIILKFIESIQKGTKVTEIMETCLFISSKSGSRSRIQKKIAAMVTVGLVRKDRGGNIYPNLKERAKQLMELHQATSEEAEAVYDHIISELLGD